MLEDAQSRINALFESYRESLPPLLEELTSSWLQLEKSWDAHLAKEFDRKVHGIAGSAATFGLEEIGATARTLEQAFKPLLDAEYDKDNPQWAASWQLFQQLQEMVNLLET